MSNEIEKTRIGINVNIPDDVVRNASGFLQRLLSPVVEVSDLLSDKLRFIRYRSAINTLSRAKEIAEARGVKLHQVPMKFLVPFLESCSIEDENSDLIERWAALLVTAGQNNKKNLNWCVRILGESLGLIWVFADWILVENKRLFL